MDTAEVLVKGSLALIFLEILIYAIADDRHHQIIDSHLVVFAELLHLRQRATQIKLGDSPLLATKRFRDLEGVPVVTTAQNSYNLEEHDEWCKQVHHDLLADGHGSEDLEVLHRGAVVHEQHHLKHADAVRHAVVYFEYDDALVLSVVWNEEPAVLDVVEGVTHHYLLAHEGSQLLLVMDTVDSLYDDILHFRKLILTHFFEVPCPQKLDHFALTAGHVLQSLK